MGMSSFLLLLLLGVQCRAWVKEMENPGLYEGDMVLTPEQRLNLRSGLLSYASIKTNHWPLTIPYDYDENITASADAVKAIQAAIDDYHKFTCLKFVKRAAQNEYLHFTTGGGCSSPVGFTGGKNDISLDEGCWDKATVLHEIAHSLGIHHEQSRPDRDSHVTILWDNIEPGMGHNFDKEVDVDSHGTPYDFHSVMHYDSTSFGSGKQTIRTNDPSKQNIIGQATGFSDIDKLQINRMYKCPVSG